MSDFRTVTEGDRVIFKTDEKTKVFQVFKTRTIFFEKSKLRGEEIIGKDYGTQFEVQHGKLVVVKAEDESRQCEAAVTGSGKDNRDLVASGENQKLSQEDILRMREEGLSGQAIIGKLVEQSETFKTKTEFSQEKYIKKKKKKHMFIFRVLRPTAALLLEVFKNQPAKICNLRADSLSQLLNYSNACWGSTVAVVESCQGLVLGSVMERMGSSGRLLHLYPGTNMNRQMVDDFNFSQAHKATLLTFQLGRLAALENGTLFPSTASQSREREATDEAGHFCKERSTEKHSAVYESQTRGVEREKDKSETSVEEERDNDDDDGDNYGGWVGSDKAEKDSDTGAQARKGKQPSGTKKHKQQTRLSPEEQEPRRQNKLKELQAAASVLQEKNLDSLIIATKHNPVSLLLRLVPYVAPSRPVVVYCQYKEPLVECYSKVKEGNLGIQLKLSESWYREYQVLPSRTHPLNNMSGTGGYMLSFIKVVAQPAL